MIIPITVRYNLKIQNKFGGSNSFCVPNPSLSREPCGAYTLGVLTQQGLLNQKDLTQRMTEKLVKEVLRIKYLFLKAYIFNYKLML